MSIAASFFGATGVCLGAFGSHYLRSRLSEDQLRSWHTAVQYQLLHAVALLALGAFRRRGSNISLDICHYLWCAGVAGFSGSIYVLALGGPKFPFGPVTPLGGLCLILGWVFLGLGSK